MSIVDEIRVTDDGDVEVRIVPPDSLSPAPDIMATYRRGSFPWQFLRHSCMRTIARELGLECEVLGVVHGGEDRYTVVTSERDYLEVDRATRPACLGAIDKVSRLVQALELAPHNEVPQAGARKTRRRGFPRQMNRLRDIDRVRRDAPVRRPFLPNPSGYGLGELNPRPRTPRREAAAYKLANTLPRVS